MSDELYRLLKLAEGDTIRKLVFSGWLNRQLEARNIKDFPVLVGGAAVSFYFKTEIEEYGR